MDVGHRQVVHEDLSSGYTDVGGLFIGGGCGLGGGCVGMRSRSGQIRVRGSGYCREPSDRVDISILIYMDRERRIKSQLE